MQYYLTNGAAACIEKVGVLVGGVPRYRQRDRQHLEGRGKMIEEEVRGKRGKRVRGEEGKRGRGEEGRRGRGEEGKRGRGEEGKRGRGEEGKRGRGEEGKRGRGEEGKRGRGEEGKVGSVSTFTHLALSIKLGPCILSVHKVRKIDIEVEQLGPGLQHQPVFTNFKAQVF